MFLTDSLELLSATSLDLDQSRLPPFWNEILYCGKELWIKTKVLVISIFFFYNNISYPKGYLLLNFTLFKLLSASPLI